MENKVSDEKIAIIKDRGTYAIEVEDMISNTSEEDNELSFTRQWWVVIVEFGIDL